MDHLNNPLHIGILGAGAIGCYIGGCLLHSGFKVTFVGREPTQSAVAQYGLTLTDWLRAKRHVPFQHIEFSLSTTALRTCNVVIITVKSGDTLDAADAIKNIIDRSTLVVSLQNGVSNAQNIGQCLVHNRVLAGMVPFNVVSPKPGHYHRTTSGQLAIAQADEKTLRLFHALQQAGLPVHTSKDMVPVLWGKLLMNLNNAVNALSGLPIQEQLRDPGYRKVLAMSIREALGVLQKAGIKPARTGRVVPRLMPVILRLPNMLFLSAARAMLAIGPKAVSSMAQDLARGRPTEIDYLNGEVVKLAKEQGLSAPVNQRILALIKAAELQNTGSPCLSAKTLAAQTLS